MKRHAAKITLLVMVLAGGLPMAGSAAAQGWGARRAAPDAVKRSKPRKKRRKRRTTKAKKNAPAVSPNAASTSDRVNALVARGRSLRGADALPVLRRAVARREMTDALRLAEAIAASRKVDASALLEAATILGRGQKIPVQRKLLARAYGSKRTPGWLQTQIVEAYFDAVIAAGEMDTARKVLDRGLRRTPAGQRRGLFERLVAWARLQSDTEQVLDELIGWRDPDAAVLAARLAAGRDVAGAGLAILRDAWRRFPAHRRLQTTYIKALARMGKRRELERVVARVVRLAPADPMPWLAVVDAHIVARDSRAARRLIDRLARRHRGNAALLETLIDREQRLPGDRGRLSRLFDALLAAAPKDAQHVEAYGEWLLTEQPGRVGKARAMKVLSRLPGLPAGRYDGLRRMAAILQTHGHASEAEKLLKRMLAEFPERTETRRLLAIHYGQTGSRANAERRWLALTVLPDAPSADQRRGAAEARRNLLALFQRGKDVDRKLQSLLEAAASAAAPLGTTLLALEALAGRPSWVGQKKLKVWRDGSQPALKRWAADREVQAYQAAAWIRRGERKRALSVLEKLDAADPDAARFLLVSLAEAGLAASDEALVVRVERRLLGPSHTSPSLLLRLGELHLRYSDSAGAAKLFRRAASADPGDTRATYRLAQLLRQSGASAEEGQVLQDIVLRTVDSDELQAAGQRLLTLSMAGGRSAELLRWLDRIAPQHPRRALLDRFRLQAYDAWLRSEVLERKLGRKSGPEPSPAMLSEALASDDLAVRVRALRQMARRGQPLPAVVARRLMKDQSAVVRRDTAIALAASGSRQAAALLVEMDDSDVAEVTTAQLIAFGRLPPIGGGEPFLVSHLKRHRNQLSGLAALALGRVGEAGALHEVVKRLSSPASIRKAPLLIAAGELVGRFPDANGAEEALGLLTQHAMSGADGARSARDRMDAMAALWGLAATATPRAKAELLDRAVDLDGAVLRLMALRLAAAREPPRLRPELWRFEMDWARSREFATGMLRRLLLPWLGQDAAGLTQALAAVEAPMLKRLRAVHGDRLHDAGRRRWCRNVRLALSGAPTIAAWCR